MMTLEEPTSIQTDHWIQQAEAALADGDLPAAQESLSQALRANPDDNGLAIALGHVKLSTGDLRGALAGYSTAAQRAPNLAAAHSGRALALQLLERPMEAELAAVRCLSITADDLVALKVLARIRLDESDPKAAQAFCRRILRRNPDDADGLKLLEEIAATTAPRLPWSSSTSPFGQLEPISRPSSAGAAPSGIASEGHRLLEDLIGDYTARTEGWQALGTEHLLQRLVVGDFKKAIEVFPGPTVAPCGSDGLPLPPVALTMGYGAGDMDHYLACGRRSYENLTRILQKHEVALRPGDSMLDWGGAAGRAVRNFTSEARSGCKVWCCDVHAPSIQWAQAHLSPPFRFFNSSSLPHLPFSDATFKFIYGLSVMTHLIALRDLWLLELERVLRPDGCLILTIHDESTWAWFRERGMPAWMPPELKAVQEMPGECVEIRGSRWDQCYTFFHSDYIRRVWGQFFDVKEIVPRADYYQSAVVLKKRARA